MEQVKVLILTNQQILVSQIEEVAPLDIGDPNCKLIEPFILKDDGTLWTAATSDHGNNGPFSSAIYELGEINHSGKFEPILILF